MDLFFRHSCAIRTAVCCASRAGDNLAGDLATAVDIVSVTPPSTVFTGSMLQNQ